MNDRSIDSQSEFARTFKAADDKTAARIYNKRNSEQGTFLQFLL